MLIVILLVLILLCLLPRGFWGGLSNGICYVILFLLFAGFFHGTDTKPTAQQQERATQKQAAWAQKIAEKKKACVGPDAEWVEDSARWGHGYYGDCFRGDELRRKQKLTQEDNDSRSKRLSP